MQLATPEITLKLDEWPSVEGHDMEFTLVYDGELYGASNNNPRAENKHHIRRQFHPQLRTLWRDRLSHWMERLQPSAKSRRIYAGLPMVEALSAEYAVGDYRCVPLVTEPLALACSLDILFLRREEGRSIIKAGDIDNRLKTLFDALRNPQNMSELAGTTPTEDEKPFFTLLQDDSLITEVHISTDKLLTPFDPTRAETCKLVIGVKLRPFRHTEWNEDFG
jgi:hypothetical protein